MSHQFPIVSWAKAVSIYEVNVRQYTAEGSFAGFSRHLSRLQDMGIDILWFMPVTPISIRERQGTLGSYYACNSYTDINPEFGSAEDFADLVQQAHTLGMKVIIDWVANHTGYDHHWTNTHPDWYLKDEEGHFTERNGWKDVIDLDYASHDMRTAMISAMRYWIEKFDIDGFRCDMAHLVPLDFWLDARMTCDAVKPLYWLAECENDSYYQVFDTNYAWWWMHVTEKFMKGESPLHDVREVLHTYSQYAAGTSKLFFTSNHDENSWNGTEYEKYGVTAKAWAVFTCTWSGIPLVYSGQENPNLKRLAFFDKDLIEWNEPPSLHTFYRQLLMARKTHLAITDGETCLLPSEQDHLMCYFRKKDKDVVLVLLNMSASSKAAISVAHEWLNGQYENLFSGISYTFYDRESFELLPGDYLVYIKKGD